MTFFKPTKKFNKKPLDENHTKRKISLLQNERYI